MSQTPELTEEEIDAEIDAVRRERRGRAMGKPEPLLDIVMLVHSQHVWSDLAIRAVEGNTKNPYRLILVDMASTPECKVVLRAAEKRGHTVITLSENRSFSNGVNTGVEAGSSKFIAILNDDAMVTEGWDGAMLQDASVKQVGLVGARSNYASGPQGDPSFIGKPPYLVFVLVALRRQVWDTIGPMDEETFDGFSSEDIDYSWRVLKAGYELKVSSAYVLHAGSRSLAASIGPEQLAKNNQKYNARLVDKWGKDWAAKYSKSGPEKLCVVTYHAENWTRVEFMKNVFGLKRSDGGSIAGFIDIRRAPIHMARQLACDYALDQGFDWVIQLDDDATIPNDLIRRMLAHQKDVVCALAYQRKIPHSICAFEIGEDGLMGRPMEGIEHTGLRKVDISGFHCSIMRTSVIKRLRDGTKDAEGKVLVPGTRQYFGGFENKLGEDFAFSLNLKKIGVQIYCDTELISGHIGSETVVDEAYKKAYLAGQIAPPAQLK